MKFVIKMWKKYEEAINYLIWGGVAFFLSLILFYVFANIMHIYEQIANIFTWILCVIFTYFTNRTFVFKSAEKGTKSMVKEFSEFATARLLTLVLENIILFVMIDLLTVNNMLSKLAGQFVVVVANYILSKLWIFKNSEQDG